MNKTTFEIPKMDCPSEENLIRVKLKDIDSILNLDFDLANRKLTVIHTDHLEKIEEALAELKLGTHRIGIETADQFEFLQESGQRKLLWIVLAINFFFFLLEMITGLISNSMGLISDSLDMLADAFVYP
jgi:copper chaperone CopZ